MRVALLADVHGNLHALEAVVDEARAESVDATWMAGDWVGYGAHPEECVDLLRNLDASGIRGDMDDEVIAVAADGSMPFQAAEEKRAALRFAAAALLPATRAWLAALPRQRALRVPPLHALLVHGSPIDPQEHLWPGTESSRLERIARDLSVEIVACGHTHAAMDRTAAGVRFLNPGSVGRPGDGDPRAGWGLLTVGSQGDIGFEPRRVAYDHEAAARAIRERGMPELVARMVREGKGMKQLEGS